MTAFIPGQAVERITPTSHVRGTVRSVNGSEIAVLLEEIVSGSLRWTENAANLRAYDPQKAQLDAAEADATTDALRDLLREAGEALRPFKRVADHISSNTPDSFCLRYQMGVDCEVRDAREASAVWAKIEEALK